MELKHAETSHLKDLPIPNVFVVFFKVNGFWIQQKAPTELPQRCHKRGDGAGTLDLVAGGYVEYHSGERESSCLLSLQGALEKGIWAPINIHYIRIYKVYMGLIIKGTIARVFPPFSL